MHPKGAGGKGPPPPMDPRRRPVEGIRPDRPRVPAQPDRHVPRQGTDPGLADSRCGRSGTVHADRRGNPSRRRDLTVAPQHRTPRNGSCGGRRIRYRGIVKPGRPTVITYADDFVALCSSRPQAETVRTQLSTWLAGRGLSLNPSKTRIVHVDDGFDFLSFTIRRYHTSGGTKVLTKPSRDAMRKIRQRNAAELRALLHSSPAEVIARMNPIIRGQGNYFRPGASKKAYQALDDHLWQHLTKWARRRHPHKSRRWIAHRYFGAFHPTRADRWIFGDRASGVYLHRYAWTPIVRHAPVPGRYSPDDPALAPYWADRRRKSRPPQLAPSWERLIRAQHGRCPACGLPLLHTDQPPDSPSQWEQWYRTVRKVLTHQGPTPGSRPTTHRLVHTCCAASRTTKRSRTIPTTADPAPP